MRKYCCLVIVFSFVFCLEFVAQEGFSKWEKGYFEEKASKEQIEFVKELKVPENVIFPKLAIEKDRYGVALSWTSFVKKSFASWFTQTKSYNYSKAVAIAYGVFNLGNYNTRYYREALMTNLNDTVWMEKTYQSVKPLLTEAWPLLDEKTRSIYAALLNQVEDYLKIFDFGAENNYLQYLKETEEEYKFTEARNYTEQTDFRKAEAFVFRRIRASKLGNGNWTIGWVGKMISDVKDLFGLK